MAARLAAALDLPAVGRVAWGADMADAIAARTRTWTTDALRDHLRAADVWCEPCTRDAWERLRAGPMTITAPDTLYGSVTSTFGPLLSLSTWTPSAFRSAPASGEHTREILRELGCTVDEIDALYANKVVA